MIRVNKKISQHKTIIKRHRIFIFFSIATISLAGASFVILSRAQSSTATFELEELSSSGNAYTQRDTTSSNNGNVRFGPDIGLGKASPGGTYADWFYPSTGLESIEWTEVAVVDPDPSLATEGLLHYYAYTFSVNNASSAAGFGYAGFQSNGIIKGIQRGKVINFSIWGSNGGNSPSPGIMNANNQESGGYQIMYPFNWLTNRKYRFQLKPGPSGIDSQGKWWGLWVTDQTSGVTTFIGEERVQTTINGQNSSLLKNQTGKFGEDLHWWRSLSGAVKYRCSSFQNSSTATINVTANNGALKPNSFNQFTNSLQLSTDSNNGYTTTNCPVTNYFDSNKNLQMNLGYWPKIAPNYLDSL